MRMNGSTPEIRERKIVSRGCPRSWIQMIPTVVAKSAYMSGTPARAITKKTRNRIRASMGYAP